MPKRAGVGESRYIGSLRTWPLNRIAENCSRLCRMHPLKMQGDYLSPIESPAVRHGRKRVVTRTTRPFLGRCGFFYFMALQFAKALAQLRNGRCGKPVQNVGLRCCPPALGGSSYSLFSINEREPLVGK